MAENLEGLKDSEVQELRLLQELARPHVEASEGKLVLLDINPEEYPSQRTYHLKSKSVVDDPEQLENLGLAADPQFPEMRQKLQESTEGTERIEFMAELLKGSNNVAIPTNHGDLTDIAKVEGSLAIDLINIMSPSELQGIRRAIIISRIVSMIGAKLDFANPSSEDGPAQEQEGVVIIPATDVLELFCHDIFLSYPRTETIESRVQKTLIKAHNLGMRRSLMRTLGKGGVLLGIAGSGTTDKQQKVLEAKGKKADPDTVEDSKSTKEKSVYRLAPIKKGTVDILTGKKTYVAPAIAWITERQVVAKLCNMPRKLSTAAEVDDVYELITGNLNTEVRGSSFVFDRTTPKA